MKCLYYLAPTLKSTHDIAEDLHEVGVNDYFLHVVSRDEVGTGVTGPGVRGKRQIGVELQQRDVEHPEKIGRRALARMQPERWARPSTMPWCWRGWTSR